MYQNSDFYDSLFQINKQVRSLKSITKPIGADYLKHQQSFIRAAVGPTTLESTKFFPKFSQSVVGSLPAPASSFFTLLNSQYKTTTIDLAKILPASAIEVAQNVASFSTLQSGISPSSLGFETITAAINSIRILPNYVELQLPAELIADDFDYNEKANPPVQSKSVIKLSPERARFLIGSILIPLMLWFASYFQSQSPSVWQEQYHQEEMKNDAKLIQQNETIIQQNDEALENQHKQYEASLKTIELLEAIYHQLEPDSKTSPASDCIPPADDSLSQAADSLLQRDASHSSDDRLNDPQAESHPGSDEPKPSKPSGSSAISGTLSESE